MTDRAKSRVSIIVPCKTIDDYTRECVRGCRELDYADFEILVLPDDAKNNLEGATVIPTGSASPGAKRNLGVAKAGGNLCAFIDSDAYPRKDWLRNAVKYLEDDSLSAVGGPGLTPDSDSFMQKSSGYVLSSFLIGSLSRRYSSVQRDFVSDDIHSCNFIARKSALEEAGGWNEQYWPGEDTLLSLAMKDKGMKMIESSDLVVYHHRRPLFLKYLHQVWSFGLHRGFFAKKFPGNSLRLTYVIPSVLLLGLTGGFALTFLVPILRWLYYPTAAIYLAMCLFEGLKTSNLKMALLVPAGIVLTHLAYGAAFIKGLTARNLRI